MVDAPGAPPHYAKGGVFPLDKEQMFPLAQMPIDDSPRTVFNDSQENKYKNL